MHIAPPPPHWSAQISTPLIDHDELLITPKVTFFGLLWHLPLSEILGGIAFVMLIAALLLALVAFS